MKTALKQNEEDKERILNLPVFPDHKAEIKLREGKRTNYKYQIQIESAVQIHFETPTEILVYLYPVVTEEYIVSKKENKQKEIVKHLKKCLTISKYLVVRKEIVENLPLVKTLERKEEDFSEKLWHLYP